MKAQSFLKEDEVLNKIDGLLIIDRLESLIAEFRSAKGEKCKEDELWKIVRKAVEYYYNCRQQNITYVSVSQRELTCDRSCVIERDFLSQFVSMHLSKASDHSLYSDLGSYSYDNGLYYAQAIENYLRGISAVHKQVLRGNIPDEDHWVSLLPSASGNILLEYIDDEKTKNQTSRTLKRHMRTLQKWYDLGMKYI